MVIILFKTLIWTFTILLGMECIRKYRNGTLFNTESGEDTIIATAGLLGCSIALQIVF